MAFGMNAERREVLRQVVQRLTRMPCTWGLRSAPVMDPLRKGHIYLRTEGLHTYTGHKLRSGTDTLVTQQAMSRRARIEIRVVSYDPNREAQETFSMLEARLWRGVTGPDLNAVGLAFTGCEDPQELPAETEDDHAVSVCIGTLTLAMADLDTEIDGFDGWIETADIPSPVKDPDSDEVTGTP